MPAELGYDHARIRVLDSIWVPEGERAVTSQLKA
jgi:hypothetical protein